MISRRSVFSNGYYKAPRAHITKSKLFEDNERDNKNKEDRGIGRTVTSEYDYSDAKVFSKNVKRKKRLSEQSSQLDKNEYLDRLRQVNKVREGIWIRDEFFI